MIYSHFTVEPSESQRGSVTDARSHSQRRVEHAAHSNPDLLPERVVFTTSPAVPMSCCHSICLPTTLDIQSEARLTQSAGSK